LPAKGSFDNRGNSELGGRKLQFSASVDDNYMFEANNPKDVVEFLKEFPEAKIERNFISIW